MFEFNNKYTHRIQNRLKVKDTREQLVVLASVILNLSLTSLCLLGRKILWENIALKFSFYIMPVGVQENFGRSPGPHAE